MGARFRQAAESPGKRRRSAESPAGRKSAISQIPIADIWEAVRGVVLAARRLHLSPDAHTEAECPAGRRWDRRAIRQISHMACYRWSLAGWNRRSDSGGCWDYA